MDHGEFYWDSHLEIWAYRVNYGERYCVPRLDCCWTHRTYYGEHGEWYNINRTKTPTCVRNKGQKIRTETENSNEAKDKGLHQVETLANKRLDDLPNPDPISTQFHLFTSSIRDTLLLAQGPSVLGLCNKNRTLNGPKLWGENKFILSNKDDFLLANTRCFVYVKDDVQIRQSAPQRLTGQFPDLIDNNQPKYGEPVYQTEWQEDTVFVISTDGTFVSKSWVTIPLRLHKIKRAPPQTRVWPVYNL